MGPLRNFGSCVTRKFTRRDAHCRYVKMTTRRWVNFVVREPPRVLNFVAIDGRAIDQSVKF